MHQPAAEAAQDDFGLLGLVADVEQAGFGLQLGALGLAQHQTLAIGDGANDLAMMAVAGVSVAYRAKPVVRAKATHALNHSGLDAALNLFG